MSKLRKVIPKMDDAFQDKDLLLRRFDSDVPKHRLIGRLRWFGTGNDVDVGAYRRVSYARDWFGLHSQPL